MKILFISDLHLKAERPDITAAFFAFLQHEAATANELFILGDFFEVWIGDDDSTMLVDSVADATKKLSNCGVKIYFMAGNRDFLLGKDFANRAGIQLINEPYVVSINGENTLLMHGDSLCTLDTDYLKFRELVRSNAWQQDFLAKSLTERRAIAQHLRTESQARGQDKSAYITDVTLADVEREMQQNKVKTLIHGHTHRPAVHHHPFGSRYVLGDWDKSFWYLKAENGSFDLIEKNIGAINQNN